MLLESGERSMPLGADAYGRIMYDGKGNMAVVMAASHRKHLDAPDKVRMSPLDKAEAFDTFEAYFGRYHVDAARGVVTHKIDGALFPNWSGIEQKRFFTLGADRLELRTPPIPYGGVTATVVVAWERID
jgi:hypothetical protein